MPCILIDHIGWLASLGWSRVTPWRWSHPDLPDIMWENAGTGQQERWLDWAVRESWQRQDLSDAAANAVRYGENGPKGTLMGARTSRCTEGEWLVTLGMLFSSSFLCLSIVSGATNILPLVGTSCAGSAIARSLLKWDLRNHHLQRRLAWPQVVGKDCDATVLKNDIYIYIIYIYIYIARHAHGQESSLYCWTRRDVRMTICLGCCRFFDKVGKAKSIYTYIYIYLYVYIYMCVCLFMYMYTHTDHIDTFYSEVCSSSTFPHPAPQKTNKALRPPRTLSGSLWFFMEPSMLLH